MIYKCCLMKKCLVGLVFSKLVTMYYQAFQIYPWTRKKAEESNL